MAVTVTVASAGGVDLRWATIYNLLANSEIIAPGTSTSTQFTIVNNGNFNGPDADIKFIITGTGFTYDLNGDPMGGTVTGVEMQTESGSVTLATYTGFSIPVADIGAAFSTYEAGGPTTPDPSGLDAIFRPLQYNVTGNTGADRLEGGTAADNISGGGGSDSIEGSGGADILDGGAGNGDEVRYDNDAANGGAAGVTVNLGAGTATDGFGNADTLSNFEGIRGTNQADTLTGSTADNFFRGLGGNDIINGGAGGDEVRYDQDAASGGGAGVTVNLSTGTATDGFGNTDTLTSIEAVRGTNQADTITGDGGDNGFRGLGGADIIDGGAGGDEVRYDADAANGGGAGVTVNLATGFATDGFGTIDTLSNIENVRGTNLADNLTGNASDNGFRGLGGNDIINGGAGFDEVRYDQDAANGGAAGVTVNLLTGTATDGFGNTDTLISIEGVRGTNSADNLTGNNGFNFFRGLGGADVINGGGGFDDVRYDQDAANGGVLGVTVNLATGTATDGFGNTDTLTNIEGARGTNQIDTLTGNGFDNQFAGLGGNDIIDGAGGQDEVRYDADAGNGGGAGVTVDLTAGTAIDGFGNTDALISIEGARGTNQIDNLTGSGGDNFFSGLGGADVIDGAGGQDEVRYDQDANNGGGAGVTVNLALNTAIDGFGNTDALTSIEGVRGTNLIDNLTGDGGDNFFSGLGGADVINGGGGQDEVRYDQDANNNGGGAGVTVNLALNTATDGFGNTDTLTSIENARGTASADILVGNAFVNVLTGLGGNDTLDGGGGDDTLIGGTGNDTYIVDSGADVVAEAAGEGTDTVLAGTTFTLSANVENLTLTGSAITGFGNGLNNVLTGNAGNNFLIAGAGNDTLYGGNGNDSLYGDDGNDVADGGTGGDVLVMGAGNDNAAGGDGNDYVYAGTGDDVATGGAGIDVFILDAGADTAYGGNDQDYFFGGDGNDILIGEGGVDVLQGEAGDDFLYGGTEGDYFYGGIGNDSGYGGDGNDIFVMEAGNDTAFGDAGQDYFYMGDGDDQMYGGAGVDVLLGEGGNDTFDGGAGIDYLFLGSGGNDTVIFNMQSGIDVINNFEAGGANDVIRLQGTPFTSFDQVLAATSDYGSFSIVTLDANTAIWLIGVTPAQLTAADFQFA